METEELAMMKESYQLMKESLPKTSVVIFDFPSDIREKYHIGHHIEGSARSSLAQFHMCTHKELSNTRVVKSYYIHDAVLNDGIRFKSHPQQDFKQILNEIKALSELSHPNIVKLYDVFFEEKYIHLVFEHCSGQELFDALAVDRFSVQESLEVFVQILEAVKYMHEKGYAHRGICIENVLFLNTDRKRVKVIGFNGADNYHAGFKLRYGSPMYMAPEVFKENYDEKCDVWSCGVVLFTMLCGHQPFQSNDFNDLMAKVVGNKFIKSENWKTLDNNAKKLVKKILVFKKRPRAEDVLKMDVIKSFSKERNKTILNKVLKLGKKSNDENFSGKLKTGNKLKIAVCKILAPLNVFYELGRLEKLWNDLDPNGIGNLEESDLIRAVQNMIGKGSLAAHAGDMIKLLDLDNKGFITKEEFVGLLLQVNDEGVIRQAFHLLDSDCDGLIEAADFDRVFKAFDYENIRSLLQDNFAKTKLDFETFQMIITRFVFIL